MGKHHRLTQVLSKKLSQPQKQLCTSNNSHLCLTLKLCMGSFNPGVIWGDSGVCLGLSKMLFSRTQTGTRQKAKRWSAWLSHRCQAFNHQPVSADPRHMAHHPHRRGSLPLPQLLRQRRGCKALPHGTDRAQTPRPSCPKPRTGGCIRGCDNPTSPAQLGL